MDDFEITHYVLTADSDGLNRKCTPVMRVEGDESGAALYTASEWEAEVASDWTLDADGFLRFQGQTPVGLSEIVAADRPAAYTWIVGSDFDPGATLDEAGREQWIEHAKACIDEHQPNHIGVMVLVAQGNVTEGLFAGHYPDTGRDLATCGTRSVADYDAKALTDAAFEHAWGAVSEG